MKFFMVVCALLTLILTVSCYTPLSVTTTVTTTETANVTTTYTQTKYADSTRTVTITKGEPVLVPNNVYITTTLTTPGTITPTSTSTTTMTTIPVISYAEIFTIGHYSDDADSQNEGISITFMFYDSKSKAISFKNYSYPVNVKLNGYSTIEYAIHSSGGTCVYEQETFFDSMDTWGNNIRISYETIAQNRKAYGKYITVELSAAITNELIYKATWNAVPLTLN